MFQSWGGGTLKEQVDAGLVQDISEDISPWIGDLNEAAVGIYQIDGKQYGIPFNLGMVGFWYNKALFEKAGIDAPPATWDEFLDGRRRAEGRRHHAARRRREGQVARACSGGPTWRCAIAGKDAMAQAGEDGSFDSEGFVKAGEELKRLIDMEPFQEGLLAAPWDGAGGEAATIANGSAAMHLMGQWAPAT